MLAFMIAPLLCIMLYGIVKACHEGITFQNPFGFVDHHQLVYLQQKEYLASWKSFLFKALLHDMLGFSFLSPFRNVENDRSTPLGIYIFRAILFMILACLVVLVLVLPGYLSESVWKSYLLFVPGVVGLAYIIRYALLFLYQGYEAWQFVRKMMQREVQDAQQNQRKVHILRAFDKEDWKKEVIREMVSEEATKTDNVFHHPVLGVIQTIGVWKEGITAIVFYLIYALISALSFDTALNRFFSLDMTDDEIQNIIHSHIRYVFFLSARLLQVTSGALLLTLGGVLVTWLAYVSSYHLRFKIVEYLLRNMYVLPLSVQVYTQFLVRTLFGFYANTVDTVDLRLFQPTDAKENFWKTAIPFLLLTFVCAYLITLSVICWIESDPQAYFHYSGRRMEKDKTTNEELRGYVVTYAQVAKAMVLLSGALFGIVLMFRNFIIDKVFYVMGISAILVLTAVFLSILFMFV